jgi:Zn ribbon nucleic-acid-binding protein
MAKEKTCPQCGAAAEIKKLEGRPKKVVVCTKCGYIDSEATEKQKDE